MSQNSRWALVYPPARRGEDADAYHGVSVADPYRWLEDPDAPEVRDWIAAQNALTERFLLAVPARERIRERITRLWDSERYSRPFREGGRTFFFRNAGLQNQSVLYVAETPDAPQATLAPPATLAAPRVLLDPNLFSEDGTVALAGVAVSRNGELLAYGLSGAGSDWQEWRVRDVGTGADHPDRVRWVKFSGAAWTHDHRGFFYSRYDEPPPGEELQSANYCQKLYYHRLGTDQAEDALVYERPDQKEWGFGAEVTEDGRYLVIDVWQGSEDKNRIFYKDLAGLDGDSPVIELLAAADAEYHFVDNDGPVFRFRTDRDAPRGRVVAIDIRQPEPERWTEILPETGDTLQHVGSVGERLFACYLADAHTRVRVFRWDGSFEREVALPGIGTAGGFGGKRGDRETFYAFTSFTVPSTIFRYDIESGESAIFRRPSVDFDPDDYETRQVFVASHDGTRVPLFLTHRKGLDLNGDNPTCLYGYGGFGISLTPAFSVADLFWMERGGVYAQASLRGGGEYGQPWHEAGKKRNKQNVFDDFLACAEWLIESNVTRPAKLAIAGHSNGGLLVGAAMTQRPDLFGAALPGVGVLDMLRFHKFTIGWGWTSDYGSPDDPDEFRALHAYSPLHNLRPGVAYPATLITTGDHDDRVVPAHSFKFAAALQAAQGGDAPVLIRIETRAGHGGGKPIAKIIDEATDCCAFLVRVLDMRV